MHELRKIGRALENRGKPAGLIEWVKDRVGKLAATKVETRSRENFRGLLELEKFISLSPINREVELNKNEIKWQELGNFLTSCFKPKVDENLGGLRIKYKSDWDRTGKDSYNGTQGLSLALEKNGTIWDSVEIDLVKKDNFAGPFIHFGGKRPSESFSEITHGMNDTSRDEFILETFDNLFSYTAKELHRQMKDFDMFKRS